MMHDERYAPLPNPLRARIWRWHMQTDAWNGGTAIEAGYPVQSPYPEKPGRHSHLQKHSHNS